MSHVMAVLTHDTSARPTPRTTSGVALGVAAALSFSLSGPVAKGMIASGWTAGSAVTARILVAAAVLLIPAVLTLRGRWHLLRENLRLIAAYGATAVAGCQLAYFNAVDNMQVGIALLILFACPLIVLAWMWLRHGQQPTRLTLIGAAITVGGLCFVLDLFSGGADLNAVGVSWALVSMVCAACFWILAGNQGSGLPGLVLAASGLTVAGFALLCAGLIGVIPFTVSSSDIELAGTSLPWWLTTLALGALTAGIPYVMSIAATRRLGSRMASFVGLAEAVGGIVFAWLLLSETPRPVQLLGGALILAGVIVVHLGEPRPAPEAPQAVAT